MKDILTIIIIFLSLINSTKCYSQNNLDTEKFKDAELFTEKKNYNVEERIKEIERIIDKEVTVFIVSGKLNKIKQTYTGIAEMANYPKITDKSKATLITVKVSNENGQMNVYFPLTNDKKFRIYLTEKMK